MGRGGVRRITQPHIQLRLVIHTAILLLFARSSLGRMCSTWFGADPSSALRRPGTITSAGGNTKLPHTVCDESTRDLQLCLRARAVLAGELAAVKSS
jgi:hypothetical protein